MKKIIAATIVISVLFWSNSYAIPPNKPCTDAEIAAGTSTVPCAMSPAGVASTYSGAAAEIEDDVYGAGWNGDTTHGPSQNAVYDKIELLDAAKQNVIGNSTTATMIFGLDAQEYDITGNTWVTATAGTTLGPDAASHLIADVQTAINTAYDGEYLHVREGAAGTPLTVQFNFASVTSFNSIQIYSYYTGNIAHVVLLQLYDFDNTEWDTFETIAGEPGYTTHSIDVINSAPYIDGSGNVNFRFAHQGTGVNTHSLQVDYIALSGFAGGNPATAASAVSVADGDTYYTGTNVETVLKEVYDSWLVNVDQDVTADGNPSFSTINVVGTNSLNLGTSSTNTGQITLKNSTNNNTFLIQPGATGANLTYTLPTAAAGGDNYLLNVDADGTMGLTDPASYLLITGGTLTGEVTVDNLGLEFTPGDDHSDCSAFSATGGGIFYDDSEGIFKKCQDNVLTDLDTGVAAPTNVTPVDTGDEDATFYLLLVDGATGSQATETDNEFSYNPSTGVLTVPSLGAHTTGTITVDDEGDFVQTGTSDADFFDILAYDLDGTAYVSLMRPVASNTPHIELGPVTNFLKVAQDGTVSFEGSASFTLPTTTSGDQTLTAGKIGIKTDEDGIVAHGGAAGEVQDEALISLLTHVVVPFDPEWQYDNTTENIVPIGTLGDESPHGITLTEWSCAYINGDPTTELDADLICDTTPDWTDDANATVMDVLDTTTGASSADSGFDSATCANASKLYIRMGADPVDTGEQIICEFWWYNDED